MGSDKEEGTRKREGEEYK